MIISYDRPILTWIASNATFLTDQDRMSNGRATSATRLLADGTFTLTSGFDGSSIVPKLAGLVGVSLDVGTSVTCAFKRAADGSHSYQSQTQTVKKRDDGSKAVWFGYADGLDAVVSVQFSVTLASVPSGGLTLDIGEAWIGPGRSVCAKATYGINSQSFGKQQLSNYGQPYPTRRNFAYAHDLELSPSYYDGTFADAASLQYIRTKLQNFAICAIVPIDQTPFQGTHTIDPDYVNRHAALCYMTGDSLTEDQTTWALKATFNEIPATL